MLTKGQNSKFRAVKYVAMVLALVAVLAFCFTSCGQAKVLSAEYLAGTLEKDQYNAGETFDCTGAQMKVTYENGDVETVAVTKEMVGDVVLSYGMSFVEATYSVDGTSVKCALPVTVIDPLAEDKSAAIAAINAKDGVKNGDKGVAAMVAEYVNKINAAATKADITGLSTAFDADLKAYVDGKAAALAKVSLTEKQLQDKGLYQQFLLDVQHAQTLAIANIKAALSVTQADDIAAAFEDTINKKLAEQAFYEGSAGNTAAGQIAQKMDIIKLINKYIAKAQNYITLIKENNPSNTSAIGKYNDAIDTLDLLKEEVRLAINLTGYKEAVEKVNEDELKTGIDTMYELIADGVVVTPAPYAEDGKTLATTDPIKELVAAKNVAYESAKGVFGDVIAEKLAKEYKYGDTSEDVVDLLAVYAAIDSKRADLDAKQNALFALNGAVADWNTTDNIPTIAEIRDAWNTLKTAGADTVIDNSEAVLFTTKPYAGDGVATKGMFDAFELVYVTSETIGGKSYEGNYAVNEWSGYYVTEGDFDKYYFPALANLIAATEAAAAEADEVVSLVGNTKPIVLTHNTELDAGARLTEARTALEAFKSTYAPAVDDVNDYLGVAIATAEKSLKADEDKYAAIVAAAENANKLIEAVNAVDAIVLADYDGVNGALKAAYDAYFAFAALNTYKNSENVDVTLTDVIADPTGYTEATNIVDNEARLLACMKKYVELKFTDEVRVQGDLTITAAYMKAIGVTSKDTDTLFRAALLDERNTQLAKLPSFADDYKYELNGEVVEETLDNILDILDANLAASQDIADDLAAAFIAFYNDKKGASMPEYEKIGLI